MQSTVRCAAKFLVASMMLLFSAAPALADLDDEIDLDSERRSSQRDNNSDDDERPLEPWESDGDEDDLVFDNRRIKRDKRNKFGFIFGEGNIGGGMVRSLDAGPETSMFSAYGYGMGSLRFAQIGLSSKVILQLGISAAVEGVGFDTRHYRGDQIRTSAGPEFAFLFMGKKKPVGMAVIRLRFGFMHETGSHLETSYKLDFQDNTLVDIDGFAETYALCQETGERAYRWGGTQVIRDAWLHATQLRYRFIVQLHSERHEPGFAESRNSTQSRYEFGLTQWVRRTSWVQGELSAGAYFEFAFSHAAGYRSVSHDNIVTTLRAGLATRVQLFRNVFLNVTPTVGYNARTDGWDAGVNFNLAAYGW